MMPLCSNYFDTIIEKGTLDVFFVEHEHHLWNPSKELKEKIDLILTQISQCLRSDHGRFISISFQQPYFRRPFLAKAKYQWSMEVYSVSGFTTALSTKRITVVYHRKTIHLSLAFCCFLNEVSYKVFFFAFDSHISQSVVSSNKYSKEEIICSKCNPEDELGLCEKCSLELKEKKFYEEICTGRKKKCSRKMLRIFLEVVFAHLLIEHKCPQCLKTLRIDHYSIFNHAGQVRSKICF
jgi:hypothetical protein